MFSLNEQVTTSTCDSEGRLKLYSALQMMQDCSELWLDSEPAARDFFAHNNMTQLLASRQVEVVRVPEYKERLTVTTSIYGMKPMFGFRNTFIYDAQGRVCYKTWAMGAFVNKSTGKLQPIDDDVLASITLDEQKPMNYLDRRIIVPKVEGQDMPSIQVLRADIDYNKHLNNANYIRMAMELLPADFVVSGLRVEYKSPARLGDLLEPVVYNTGQGYFVTLSTHGAKNAILEFTP
jgi:acyl-ACP thioesterase